MALAIYLVIPMYMGLLYALSADEEVTADSDKKGLQRALLKIASFIYKKFFASNGLFLKSKSKRRVYESMKALNSQTEVNDKVKAYYIEKISIALLMILLGAFISAASFITARRSTIFDEEGKLIRGDYGSSEHTENLTVKGESGESYGDFELDVADRIYTKEQVDALLDEMLEKLPEDILQDNESLEKVTGDLRLSDNIAGYPFDISWQSDNLDIIHTDGRVTADEISEDGESVALTAVISYGEMEWRHSLSVHVLSAEMSPLEKLQKNIRREMIKSEENTRAEASFYLPGTVDGISLSWSEQVDDKSPVLMILVILSAVLVFVVRDTELSKEVEQRRKNLILEYPQFVQRLVLYMGAGMSVRGAFKLFAEEYRMEKKLGKKSLLYEEITRSCHELETGLSEPVVYERFGIRCGTQQYTRLVTLLTQNLKKGNSEIMELLREETDKATRERMSYARKLGEEAGTKLLFPMVLMLVIVMVVVVVPAYLSF